MLVTFKAHSSQRIDMLENLAQWLLGIVGKKLGERGAIGSDETGEAIAKLEAAIAADKAVADKENEGKKSDDRDDDNRLRLSQRAYPLLNMLKEAQAENCAVMWEVSAR
ncbi:DUF1840 domain-containing protein [Pandoraea commovens]|uniref:DUF1840 domain-containing protein n=1 Tax=Pandoraea commovens TaxID=2508289 RepID=A0A5E4UIW3_9BURK|nr:DUF1840 domain-containing protein [Pandoraea commovens]UVA79934.1 DUF1840 domain-containing protein [Pandoraea commovens]VVD98199.1 hypothetical protein PCO31010_02008 [Pandoraea commovens]